MAARVSYDSDSAHTTGTSLNDTQQQLLTYLRDKCQTKTYFKSRLIGDQLDLSSKEVGLNMAVLADADLDGITVEKWGYSKATTWKVTQD